MTSDTDRLRSEQHAPGSITRLMKRGLLQRFDALRDSQLTLREADGEVTLGTPAGDPANTLSCKVRIHDSASFYQALARNGSVGAAEAYMDGVWESDDLTTLIRMLVRNRDILDAMEGGVARVGGWLMRIAHALRRNTRSGSQRNIAEHYDLGNELFELFLDPTMMYSSAIFTSPEQTLEDAQQLRMHRLCQKLELKPGDHLLEIGTGWGGFAVHAAKHYGCKVTTTTISKEQHAWAGELVQREGLADSITLLLRDYRDLDGQYDKLVSIEMIEAIGHQYLDTYFAKCSELLKPEGLMALQAITIEDHRYQQALNDVDFIKRYIFPGSFIPSVSAMLSASARASDLRLFNLEDIGPSYALTLRHWRERFLHNHAKVRALGYPERFVRMWEFYFCYCEGGFLERSIGDVHMLFCKPNNRRDAYLPGLLS